VNARSERAAEGGKASKRAKAGHGETASKSKSQGNGPSGTTPAARRRLSYREQQELKQLPASIEELESAIAALHEALAEPDFYTRPGEEIARETARLKQLDDQLAAAYMRWEALEERAD
jgi:ATP-binding cassette subfamily F protein uup